MRYVDKVAEQGHMGKEGVLPKAGIALGGMVIGAMTAKALSHRETIESKHEVQIDTSHLITQVSGLLNSVGVAIARLESKGQMQSGKMSEFETVRSQALRVLSALEQPGSAQLEVLSSMASAINATFTEETTASFDADPGADDVAKAEKEKLMMLSQRHVAEKVNADPLMLALAARTFELEEISTSHNALAAHAVTSANDAKEDVNRTIELASMRYNGASREELDAYLATTQAKMVADMQASPAYLGVPDEVIAHNARERIEFIQKHGERVEAAMHQGGEATRLSLLNAAEESIDLHARHLKTHGHHHFSKALTQLNGYMDDANMDAIMQHAAGWDEQRHNAHHSLKDKLQAMHAQAGPENGPPQGDAQAYLQGILQASGAGDVLGENVTHGQQHAASLHKTRAVLDAAYQRTLDDRAALSDVLSGRDHSKIDHLAASLHMEKAELVKKAAEFQNVNGIPAESAGKLNGQIKSINAALYTGPETSMSLLSHK